VRLLNEALVRVGCPCKVAVLLNDSVAVLAAKK
jgi:hexokinase